MIQKLLGVVLVVIYWGSLAVGAPGWDHSAGSKSVRDGLETVYRQSYQYESMRVFADAKQGYQTIQTQFWDIEKNSASPSEWLPVFPVALASAFRFTMVCVQENFSVQKNLIDQINDFNQADTQINQLLKLIIDTNQTVEGTIPRVDYACLFYARGLSKIVRGVKLLQGTAWKSYVVYPVSDILALFQSGMRDIDQSLVFDGVSYAQLREWKQDYQARKGLLAVLFRSQSVDLQSDAFVLHQLEQIYLGRLQAKSSDETSYKIQRFIYCEERPDHLARILAKRTYFKSFALLAYYQSRPVQKILKRSTQQHTLSEIMARQNKPLFEMGQRLMDIGG